MGDRVLTICRQVQKMYTKFGAQMQQWAKINSQSNSGDQNQVHLNLAFEVKTKMVKKIIKDAKRFVTIAAVRYKTFLIIVQNTY